jgi:hypothetical protein
VVAVVALASGPAMGDLKKKSDQPSSKKLAKEDCQVYFLSGYWQEQEDLNKAVEDAMKETRDRILKTRGYTVFMKELATMDGAEAWFLATLRDAKVMGVAFAGHVDPNAEPMSESNMVLRAPSPQEYVTVTEFEAALDGKPLKSLWTCCCYSGGGGDVTKSFQTRKTQLVGGGYLKTYVGLTYPVDEMRTPARYNEFAQSLPNPPQERTGP